MIRTVALRALLAAALVVSIPIATAAQDEELSPRGTEWYLTAYDAGGPELTDVPWDLVATLNFGEYAYGSDGCNPFGAGYSLDGEALTFSGPGHTDMGCGAQVTAIEEAYIAALTKVARASVFTGNTSVRGMLLFDAHGRHLLSFSSSPTEGLFGQVRELTELVDAQQQVIAKLQARIKELEQGG